MKLPTMMVPPSSSVRKPPSRSVVVVPNARAVPTVIQKQSNIWSRPVSINPANSIGKRPPTVIASGARPLITNSRPVIASSRPVITTSRPVIASSRPQQHEHENKMGGGVHIQNNLNNIRAAVPSSPHKHI
jgi:hypothetical protein